MKQLRHKGYSNNKGQLAITIVITLSVILMTVTISELFLGYNEYSQSSYDATADQALEIAESAIDNAILEYEGDSTYTGGTFTTPIGSAQVTASFASNVLTVTAKATYHNITRTEKATVNIAPRPAIENQAVYLQNNFWMQNSTLNGEIFTSNDINFYSSTINGDLYAVGKGNGQHNLFDNVKVNPYNGSGGNVEWWDQSDIQDNSEIKGNLTYHANTKIDASSKVDGQMIQTGNSLPQIATPYYNFSSTSPAYTTAVQNGTYYANSSSFFTYLYSLTPTNTNGNDIYTLPPGVYYVDCPLVSGVCQSIFNFPSTDGHGNPEEITGNNVSLIINMTTTIWGGINIISPYQSGSTYFPAVAVNGLVTFFATPLSFTVNGIVYASSTMYFYGFSQSTQDVITGAVWGANQIYLFGYTTITYNQAYAYNSVGFNFPNSTPSVTSWYEVP